MATTQATALKKFLMRHPLLTFVLMGASFLVFGLISLNLIYIFHANLELLLEHGQMALWDGGLQQLIELLVSGYLALMFYLLFKLCEKVLVDRVTERPYVSPDEDLPGA
ncbi:MAG: hypothetical protein EPO06_06170 [Burkholderiaceae bacterium]|nr:MAG: hypothetical protein EPO06_06170 [Burkholderiaceae bacterium]